MLKYVCVLWFSLLITVIEHNCVYDQNKLSFSLVYFFLQI